MTFKQICDSIFRLYLYADLTKKIHYSTDKNHTHELCDELRDSIVEFTDSFAEQSFGYYGKPSFNDFSKLSKTTIDETDDLKAICERIEGIISALKSEYSKNNKLAGTVSLIDDFQGKLNQTKFLCTFDKISNHRQK